MIILRNCRLLFKKVVKEKRKEVETKFMTTHGNELSD